MIVRLMGEGQFLVADELASDLHQLDTNAVHALEDGDETDLRRLLEAMGQLVRERGERLHDAHLGGSDLIIPPADLSLAEARELYIGEGLVPELPSL